VKSNLWLKKAGMISVAMFILLASIAGCHKESSGKNIKMVNLDTAYSVTQTNGQIDWRRYTPEKTFTPDHSSALWVVFSFSNALHGKVINVKGNIYIVQNGLLIDQKSKDVNWTDSADNTLYWGDVFDVSGYSNGNYTIIVTITDLISATSDSIMKTVTIGTSK
jgi:hypothetical protein